MPAALAHDSGYVAGAYGVFLALLCVYVAIMAVRLARTRRRAEALREDAERAA